MPRVLALDIATVTGYAHDGPDAGRPIARSWRAPRPNGGDGGTDFGPTFAGFQDWLADLVAVVKPEVIAYEAPLQITRGSGAALMTNQNTIRILFGLPAFVEALGHKAGIRVVESNVQKVKAHFGASGLKREAAKRAVKDRCRLLGWSFTDDNAADAAALWSLTKATLEPKWSPSSTPLFGRVGA